MRHVKLRSPEERQKVVDEQGKVCRKLNEIIKEKNKIIKEQHQKNISLNYKIKQMALTIERLELGE